MIPERRRRPGKAAWVKEKVTMKRMKVKRVKVQSMKVERMKAMRVGG
jgi:hypothetical protein